MRLPIYNFCDSLSNVDIENCNKLYWTKKGENKIRKYLESAYENRG